MCGMELSSNFLRLSLLVLLVFPMAIQQPTNLRCNEIRDNVYYNIYLELEDALIKSSILEILRVVFLYSEVGAIDFTVELGANTPNLSDYYFDRIPTLCPSSNAWKLCPNCSLEHMVFSSRGLNRFSSELKKLNIVYFVSFYLSLLHGSLLTVYVPFLPPPDIFGYDDQYGFYAPLNFTLEPLYYNPSCLHTQCALRDLLSWIEVYSLSEPGTKPLNWDETHKGTVRFGEGSIFGGDTTGNFMFLNLSLDESKFVWLSVAEYVVVSLSLALALAKFFPAYLEKEIASRVTRSRSVHQSLYWGVIVVCNIFTYCLLFVALRGFSIFLQSFYLTWNLDSTPETTFDSTFWASLFLASLQELIIHGILFTGALISSRKYHKVDLPTGVSKSIVKLSFGFGLCCYKCSERSPKTMLLFSCMNLVYHIVMDAIGIVYLLFIKEYRAVLVSVTFLCLSFFAFLIMCLSYILFHCRSTRQSLSKMAFSGGQTLMVAIIFPALMLLVIMCIMIVFSLNLQGLTGVVTGLIPSVALSAASWYLKNRLEEDLNESDDVPAATETENGATSVEMINLERGREEMPL